MNLLGSQGMLRKIIVILFTILLIGLLACQPLPVPPVPTPEDGTGEISDVWPAAAYFVPLRILRKPAGITALDESDIPSLGVEIIDIVAPASADPLQATLTALASYRDDPDTVYAELDGVFYATQGQWHLDTANVRQAWQIERGEGAVISIIDTGVDTDHPNLRGKIIAQKDYFNGDDDASDDQGHGTHVAGIAAASNVNGVSGVCPECEIAACKALGANGAGSFSAAARCIAWSQSVGADIINMSFGAPQFSQTIEDAVRQAWDAGLVPIAAAGNDGSGQRSYPAGHQWVLAVAATDQAGRRASFSNYGGWVAFAFPGVGIYSTEISGSYGVKSGTSMASPGAAGVAALLKAQDSSRSPGTIKEILEATAKRLGPELGAGRLDASAAVRYQEGPPPTAGPSPTARPTQPPQPTEPPSGDKESLTALLINEERRKNGLGPLRVDARLIESARRHSADIASIRQCTHFGSDGSNPFDRMRDAGYPRPYGEVVACGFQLPENVVNAWMNSPGHRAILLCGPCSDIGIGIAGNYWTGNFGSASPPIPTEEPRPTVKPPTATRQPSATVRPTITPTDSGFWLWCDGSPLACQERIP